jgi:hypothetical protein
VGVSSARLADMISRQIGATQSLGSGPGLTAFSPSMTCASRSGRKTTEPSRFLISPTSSASCARWFSRASSAVDVVDALSQRQQRRVDGGRVGHAAAAVYFLACGADGAAPDLPAGADAAPACAAVQALGDHLLQCTQLGLDLRLGLGNQLFADGALHVATHALELAVHRRFQHGDDLLEFVFGETLFQQDADGGRRQLQRTFGDQRHRFFGVLAHVGFDVARHAPRAARRAGAG